jgi:hypothetical protein
MSSSNEIKLCCKCHINERHKNEAYCLGCRRKYYTKYYELHKEKICETSKRRNGKRNDKLRERKLKFVIEKGGKCILCGYNKNLAALIFHHTNGRDKPVNSYNRKYVYYETPQNPKFDPTHTELLCRNCHAELEHPNLIIEILKKEYNEHVKCHS